MTDASTANTDCGLSKVSLQVRPFIRHKQHLRGFLYEVETGILREVTA